MCRWLRFADSAKKITKMRLSRVALASLPLIAVVLTAPTSGAQMTPAVGPDSVPRTSPSIADNYWPRFALGFAGSLLAHEAAHILASLAVGAHPYLGFDKARPTVFSGIDSEKDPHKQFLFSAAGLTIQTVINEGILDFPHTRGGAIERGILAGGFATTLFYVTLGRNASVSDISLMARTSSLSKTQLSLIFGGASALQALRVSRNPAYSHFFVRPDDQGLMAGFHY
jgi:hypothetical protein